MDIDYALFILSKGQLSVDIGIAIGWAIGVTFIVGIILLTLWSIREYRLQRAVYRYLLTLKEQQPDILFFEQTFNRYVLDIINGKAIRKRRGMITLSSTAL